jgi:hypothetical protein
MKYTIQKIIMENCTIYNFLYKNELLGHLIENQNSKVLVKTSDTPIIPIVEAFNISGDVWLLEDGDYKLRTLNGTSDFEPIFEFKVVNLSDNLLTESEISE